MWGRLESRYPSFESRVRSLGLRADADLSSIIEENTPESEGGAGSDYLVSTCLKLRMEGWGVVWERGGGGCSSNGLYNIGISCMHTT